MCTKRKLIKLNNEWVIISDELKPMSGLYYDEFIKKVCNTNKAEYSVASHCKEIIAHSNHPEISKINFNGCEGELGIIDVIKLTLEDIKDVMEEAINWWCSKTKEKYGDINNIEDFSELYTKSLTKTEWDVEVEMLENEVKIIKIL